MVSLRSRRSRATSRSERPSPYTSAVSMKLTPRSMERCKAASEFLSSTLPHEPPMAQLPKETVETFQPVRPRSRYCIIFLSQNDCYKGPHVCSNQKRLRLKLGFLAMDRDASRQFLP